MTPTFFVEAAFGSNPTDSSYSWTTLMRSDVSSGAERKVRKFSYQRGRSNERNRTETGTAAVVLRDPDSDFDPNNTGGLYYPDVKPMCPIRAYATIGMTDYPMFLHYADRWPRTLRVTDVYTERQLTTVDGFAWLALAGLAGFDYDEEETGARIENVLDDISWPAALRDLDTGSSIVMEASFANSASDKALDHLQAVADTEDGLAYINGAGEVRFIERHNLLLSPFTTSQATFSDVEGANRIRYQQLVPSYDLDNVTNEWSGTREDGATQSAVDSTSRNTYGPRSQQITSLATTDAEVLASVQWKLIRFKNPLNRVESITAMPGNSDDDWATLLALDVGDRITLKETPPGFDAEQSTEYTIQHLSVNIAGDVVSSAFTFQLWPADTNTWLVLNENGRDELSEGNLLCY